MPNSGITTGTPAKIPFGAGVYFQGVTYDEKVAPKAEEIKAAIIGATQEGGTLTITPEFFAPELDGATVAIKELQTKVGETAQMETSFAELTADLMARMAIGKIGETTDGEYDVITSSEIRAGHFYDGFGYYGKYMDGRPMIILFKQALCTSGFTTDAKNKANSVFKGTFACMSDIEYGTTKLPYAIFIRKIDGWTAVTPDELTAA
jgi:hypothetical protein